MRVTAQSYLNSFCVLLLSWPQFLDLDLSLLTERFYCRWWTHFWTQCLGSPSVKALEQSLSWHTLICSQSSNLCHVWTPLKQLPMPVSETTQHSCWWMLQPSLRLHHKVNPWAEFTPNTMNLLFSLLCSLYTTWKAWAGARETLRVLVLPPLHVFFFFLPKLEKSWLIPWASDFDSLKVHPIPC